MNKQLVVRCTREQYAFLSAISKECELSKSQFVRFLIEKSKEKTEDYLDLNKEDKDNASKN